MSASYPAPVRRVLEIVLRSPQRFALILAVPLIVAASWGAYSFARGADQMAWDCGGGTCATNDPRAFALTGAIIAAVLAGVLGGYALGLLGSALALFAPTLAFHIGVLQAASATNASGAGIAASVTLVILIISGIVAIVGVVLLLRRGRTARRSVGR